MTPISGLSAVLGCVFNLWRWEGLPFVKGSDFMSLTGAYLASSTTANASTCSSDSEFSSFVRVFSRTFNLKGTITNRKRRSASGEITQFPSVLVRLAGRKTAIIDELLDAVRTSLEDHESSSIG